MEQFKKNEDLYNFFFQNKGNFNDSRAITTKILSAAGLDITEKIDVHTKHKYLVLLDA
jgi:hypothetical protein